MRFLVDESAGASVADHLRAQGHDAVSVAESMPQAEDSAILSTAFSQGRIVVTNDKDFGDLVFRSGQAHAGVLLLRLHDESATNRVRVVEAVLQQASQHLPGNFVVATERHIRIRSRP